MNASRRHWSVWALLWICGAASAQGGAADAPVVRVDGDVRQPLTLSVTQLRSFYAAAQRSYRVVFSWPELVNVEAGAAVMVAHERDGQPLADSEGPLAVVAPGDTRSGPRSVKWLDRIEVRVLRD